MSGWTKMSIDESISLSSEDKKVRKDERKKRSLSMVGWDELEEVGAYLGEDVQSYDYLWKDAVIEALRVTGYKIVKK